MTALLFKLGFDEALVQSKLAAGTSTFVLAYAIHKLFAPVRISITLVSVPFLVRYFRKTGLFKPPAPNPWLNPQRADWCLVSYYRPLKIVCSSGGKSCLWLQNNALLMHCEGCVGSSVGQRQSFQDQIKYCTEGRVAYIRGFILWREACKKTAEEGSGKTPLLITCLESPMLGFWLQLVCSLSPQGTVQSSVQGGEMQCMRLNIK